MFSRLLGVFVNDAAVLAGTVIGLLFRKVLSEKYTDAAMKAVALCVLYIGISGALKGQNAVIAILSLVLGTLVGTLADLDGLLAKLGDRLQSRFAGKGTSSLSESFVSATLLFCVGAMAIVGSLSSGLSGDHATLYSKAVLDGISSIVFASTLGIGVALSIVPMTLYQGGIVLLAAVVAPYLGETVIAEMTCVGSLVIIALGLNMLGITKIKVANMVPAIFLPILLCLFL
ncbi:MAG: DUF554 domain-containing protein [Ruminococcus sp.]|nr:DUF554 domain-containing protein [Candidatus Apopatosoma intestinale]